MSKYVIDNDTLTAIGDAIRTVDETTDSIPVVDIPNRILTLEKPGSSGITLTGKLDSAFKSTCWTDKVISQFNTKDIRTLAYAFQNNTAIVDISGLEIDCDFSWNDSSFTDTFYGCNKLKKLPKLTGECKPRGMFDIFYNCYCLPTEEITNFLDSINYDKLSTTAAQSHFGALFEGCASLRAPAPAYIIRNEKYDQRVGGVDAIYYHLFKNCWVLDEILDLPIIDRDAYWSANSFNETFYCCGRLKNMTFETNADGTPVVVEWENQNIKLNYNVGYVYDTNKTNITKYNSGITTDKLVSDDATYQALKNDPDWYTTDSNYSRYNHDSAVATINSLPDASAYLAANSGTINTITFLSSAGASTDGGAVNTLTEEEIAVAAAKGWTIAYGAY